MKKLFTFLAFSLIAAALYVKPANAGCTALYGGGESCPTSNLFTIEKLVLSPVKGGVFVNNLSVNDPKYAPGANVTFKLTVKNTGTVLIPTLKVVDTFPPAFLSFISVTKEDGSTVSASFDNSSKVLTFTVSNLGGGQNQVFTVVGKLSDANMLPSDETKLCLVNSAMVTDDNTKDGPKTAQFCVQKQVLGQVFPAPKITTTPPTGPEMLPIALLLPGAVAGLALRKKAKKFNSQGGEK